MRIVDARFFRCVDKRSGGQDKFVVVVDRGLKSGKFDQIEVTPDEARHLAMRLLMGAEKAEGKEVRTW